MSKNISKARAERCVTHSYACDCREYRYQEMLAALQAALRDYEAFEFFGPGRNAVIEAIKKARGE
jgi:hypothetical protein